MPPPWLCGVNILAWSAVSMCVYTDTHTQTDTHRHTGRQTHRHRQTLTDIHRHTDRHTHTHTHTHTQMHTHPFVVLDSFMRHKTPIHDTELPRPTGHVTFQLCGLSFLSYPYGGLNKMSPHSLRHLNTWCPVGGAGWGDLGGVALLEEVCQWR